MPLSPSTVTAHADCWEKERRDLTKGNGGGCIKNALHKPVVLVFSV